MLNAIRRPSIATGAAQASGYEQRHHPLRDVPGFCIKILANSNYSPPWGQRLIFIKERKKVLQVLFDPAQQHCPPFEHLLGPTCCFF